MKFNLNFYRDRRVLVTGCSGFKGAWLCKLLVNCGAKVTGYAIGVSTSPSLFELAKINEDICFVNGDVRNLESLMKVFNKAKPEIVIHLAAQPLVRESYRSPVFTYETNVIGTVNVLECVRRSGSVGSFLNVTTDKVYKNKEWIWGYRENEELNGFDPYSNSKSCSELVTQSYKRCFFIDESGRITVPASTARAGNVIGGGDFSEDRIIPDCVRAAIERKDIQVRNPYSVRPYQHVLEPIYAYLMIAARQYEDISLADAYNVGPKDLDCVQTGNLVDMFVKYWGEGLSWNIIPEQGPHEAGFLKLDCSKIKSKIGWEPHWNLERAVQKVVEWNKCWIAGRDIRNCMDDQIYEFLKERTGWDE